MIIQNFDVYFSLKQQQKRRKKHISLGETKKNMRKSFNKQKRREEESVFLSVAKSKKEYLSKTFGSHLQTHTPTGSTSNRAIQIKKYKQAIVFILSTRRQ